MELSQQEQEHLLATTRKGHVLADLERHLAHQRRVLGEACYECLMLARKLGLERSNEDE